MTAANSHLPTPAIENERRAHEPSMEEILASIRRIIADEEALPLTRRDESMREGFAPPSAPEQNVTPLRAAQIQPADDEGLLLVSEPRVARRPVIAVAPPREEARYQETRHQETHYQETRHRDEDAAPVEPAQPVAPMRPARLEPATIAAPQPREPAASAAEPAEQLQHLWRAPEPEAAPVMVAQPPAVAAAPRLAPPAPANEPILSEDANTSIASAFEALSASVALTHKDLIERNVQDMLRPLLKQWLDDNLPVMVERMVRAEIERVARGGR